MKLRLYPFASIPGMAIQVPEIFEKYTPGFSEEHTIPDEPLNLTHSPFLLTTAICRFVDFYILRMRIF